MAMVGDVRKLLNLEQGDLSTVATEAALWGPAVVELAHYAETAPLPDERCQAEQLHTLFTKIVERARDAAGR